MEPIYVYPFYLCLLHNRHNGMKEYITKTYKWKVNNSFNTHLTVLF